MNLVVSFDQSVGGLPAGFVTAVNYVVNYFDQLFTNPVTVNIAVGYGEIDGFTLASNALGESLPGTRGKRGMSFSRITVSPGAPCSSRMRPAPLPCP